MTLFVDNRKFLNDFRHGKHAALRQVYDHYVKQIKLLVANGWYDPEKRTRTYGILDLETQAELIQEIFIKAFSEKTRLSYDGVRPYKHYLLTIARNVIIDHIRKQPRDMISHASVDIDDVSLLDQHGFGGGDTAQEADLDWQRCLEATAAFVREMDPMTRRFVALRFQEELPLSKVAECLGVSRGKARHLEKELGRMLKQYLQTMNLSVNWKE